MAKLIQKSGYIKSGGTAAGYMKYIAGRENVEKLQGNGPATENQKKLIAELLRDFPDAKGLFEYGDYTAAPTFGNASAFITMALDANAHSIQAADGYMKYIATRPRAERHGEHGLFSDADSVSLSAAIEDLNSHDGRVWTFIYSLRREDAARLGYDSAAQWRRLILSQKQKLAETMRIPAGSLRWYAAFHDEGHHPHIHMMVWSDAPKQEGCLNPNGIAAMRSALTNEAFKDELYALYKEKDLSYKEVTEKAQQRRSPVPYIHFTEEQKNRAASVDLEEFLRIRGEKLIRSGGEKRMASDHSVTVRGNRWYDHEAERGGGPVSFLQTFCGLSYPEAVSLLLDGGQGVEYPAAKQKEEAPPKPFEPPTAHSDCRCMYAYLLKQRHIDREVISHFVKAGLLYEDAKYHNCVFVGTDENGIPRHAHKRSTNSYGEAFRINVEGSDPRYSFHYIGKDDQLFVFEAPIDLLSYITLNPDRWERHSYAACCGTSSIPVLNLLDRLPQLRQVFLCLDNDGAGHAASQRMAELIAGRGLSAERLTPKNKDWNEDLVSEYEQEEVQGFCQTFGS